MDLLTENELAEDIANLLLDATRKLNQLKVTQVVNGASDDDIYPEGGDSYAVRRAKLEGGIQKLSEGFPDLMPLALALLQQRKDQMEAVAAAAAAV